ncbi:MAG: hypothetical protein P0Y65_11810 [Candidatus Devosia phytovorans]|uniref:Uncharacterized protein n=1 Tax=Candidatus Devosia phytovorans TaxID=3121372 RepID=A0AAJ5VRK2_9HYPH|nr:hypothetical protein [Devosia sp.]WEK02896.1 MAG: hypothetical protein P0Y65_11810 [Devosia sp.]
MFFPYDATNEIVAHFIGYFELSVEDMRVRLDFSEFAYVPPADDIPGLIAGGVPDLEQKYGLLDSNPDVAYAGPDWAIHGHARPHANAPEVPIERVEAAATPGHLPEAPAFDPDSQAAYLPAEGVAPLSTLAFINQTIILDDNDIVIIGDFEGSVTFVSGSAAAILGFQSDADAIVNALIGEPDFSHYTGIAGFLTDTAARIGSLGEDAALEQASVVQAPSGTYVNGLASSEPAPDLLDHLPAKMVEVMTGEAPEEIAAEEDDSQPVSIVFDDAVQSMQLNAGGNLLVNEIAVVNGGLSTSILAVQGNYHQLDAIIQINAYSDYDTVIGAPDGHLVSAATTQAYNIANFDYETRDSLGKSAETHPGVMPLSWNVTVVAGDLVFVEWMKQFTFQSDQDIHVMSAVGLNTVVTTGENIGFNAISFVDLGKYFDLVIVGGNLYDANIIVQTNILYDNDTIQYLGGGHSGTNNLATQGNLLWNEASIHNIGPAEIQSAMPDHISEAASTLSSGGNDMPGGFGADAVFEGLSALRVLYVAGDIYDMRFLQQTNVLGDADFVALQQARLIGDHPGTNWDINTGANALVNKATIFDYDGMGDTAYVAGEHYSDAILIQANILAAAPQASPGDALVTEVIAFLDHDVPDVLGDDGPFSSNSLSSDGPPADIMQSVLA